MTECMGLVKLQLEDFSVSGCKGLFLTTLHNIWISESRDETLLKGSYDWLCYLWNENGPVLFRFELINGTSVVDKRLTPMSKNKMPFSSSSLLYNTSILCLVFEINSVHMRFLKIRAISSVVPNSSKLLKMHAKATEIDLIRCLCGVCVLSS